MGNFATTLLRNHLPVVEGRPLFGGVPPTRPFCRNRHRAQTTATFWIFVSRYKRLCVGHARLSVRDRCYVVAQLLIQATGVEESDDSDGSDVTPVLCVMSYTIGARSCRHERGSIKSIVIVVCDDERNLCRRIDAGVKTFVSVVVIVVLSRT